jgi:uncharacterized phage infection (PIP) family protein YhgE
MAVSVAQNGSQIAALYQQYLGRSAAPSEIADWVNHTNANGGNLDTIRAGISGASEAQRFAATGSPTPTVADHSKQIGSYYQQYLGRSASEQEISDWVGHTVQNSGNLESIRQGIANHQEAKDYSSRWNDPAPTVTQSSEPAQPEPEKKSDPKLDELIKTFNDYKNQFDTYANSFDTALAQNSELGARNSELSGKVSELEENLRSQSAEFESTKDELQGFRDREFGGQLARLRSGSTSGGAGYSSGGGDIASGAPSYQSSGGGRGGAIKIEANDNSLAGGSGVTQLTGGSSSSRRSPSTSRVTAVTRVRNRLASGGSSRYYASRFG